MDALTVRGQKNEEIGKDRLHGYVVRWLGVLVRSCACHVVFSVVSHTFLLFCSRCVVPSCFGVLDIKVCVRCNPQPDNQTVIHNLYSQLCGCLTQLWASIHYKIFFLMSLEVKQQRLNENMQILLANLGKFTHDCLSFAGRAKNIATSPGTLCVSVEEDDVTILNPTNKAVICQPFVHLLDTADLFSIAEQTDVGDKTRLRNLQHVLVIFSYFRSFFVQFLASHCVSTCCANYYHVAFVVPQNHFLFTGQLAI